MSPPSFVFLAHRAYLFCRLSTAAADRETTLPAVMFSSKQSPASSTSQPPRAAEVFTGLLRILHLISTVGAQEPRTPRLTPAQYQIIVLLHRRPQATQRKRTKPYTVRWAG